MGGATAVDLYAAFLFFSRSLKDDDDVVEDPMENPWEKDDEVDPQVGIDGDVRGLTGLGLATGGFRASLGGVTEDFFVLLISHLRCDKWSKFMARIE